MPTKSAGEMSSSAFLTTTNVEPHSRHTNARPSSAKRCVGLIVRTAERITLTERAVARLHARRDGTTRGVCERRLPGLQRRSKSPIGLTKVEYLRPWKRNRDATGCRD